ncbi:MAG: hypothetical protein PGN07_08115 [Aeromicrobium erythreum]
MRRATLAILLLCGLVGSLLAGCQREAPPVPGCGADVRAGTTEHTIDVDGEQRSYLMHVPRDVDGQQLPVVWLFHGLGDKADTVLKQTDMVEMSEDRDAIVVVPQADGSARDWDVYGMATGQGGDARLVDTLKRRIEALRCVDDDRQYVTGMSNGSGVVFAMACRGLFRAYAGVALTFYAPQCDDAPPASILYVHGTADRYVPFRGGPTPLFPVDAATTVIGKWARHDECSGEPTRTTIGSDVTRTRWVTCADGSRIDYYVVRGGGHTWPGSTPIPPLGKTTDTIKATRLVADFFDL